MSRTEPHTKVLWSDELLDSFAVRDIRGNLITVELGEPDEDGFYTPVLTTHYDDNLVEKAEAKNDELLEAFNGLMAENERLRGYIRMALDELGVPMEMYPANVANAVDFLNESLKSDPIRRVEEHRD